MIERTPRWRILSTLTALCTAAGCGDVLDETDRLSQGGDSVQARVDLGGLFGSDSLPPGLTLRGFDDAGEQVGAAVRVSGLGRAGLARALGEQGPVARYALEGYLALRRGGAYRFKLQDRDARVRVFFDADGDGAIDPRREAYGGAKLQLTAGVHALRVTVEGDQAPSWKRQELKRDTAPKLKLKELPDVLFVSDPLPEEAAGDDGGAGFVCDVRCPTGTALAPDCEASSVAEGEADCQARRQACCVAQDGGDTGFACEISCPSGSALSGACEPSTVTADAAACAARQRECCVDQSRACVTFCGDGQTFLPDAQLRGQSCAAILAGLSATDVECSTPGADVAFACCQNVVPPPPAPASNPCLRLCPDGAQMVGSRMIPTGEATCWDYAVSLGEDDPRCLAPDAALVGACCGAPQPQEPNLFKHCCMCGDCSSARPDHVIGAGGQTCIDVDVDMSFHQQFGSPMCEAMQAAFGPTCCDPDFEPPPPVPGQKVVVPPCEKPNPPAYCDGPHPTCDLCRDRSFPKKPFTITAIAYIQGNPTCSDLYWMGREGSIPPALCYPIQNFMEEPCGCN